ncbi:MAG: hypothetical protein ABL904_15970 [Hyphomicrobiaceae bacterium]
MSDVPPKLPPDCLPKALAAISVWQQVPDRPVECPVCGAASLAVVDRSARPYTAWFALSCAGCGLVDNVTYPLGGAGGSWS